MIPPILSASAALPVAESAPDPVSALRYQSSGDQAAQDLFYDSRSSRRTAGGGSIPGLTEICDNL